MEIKLTVVFRKFPEGYAAFVEELPGRERAGRRTNVLPSGELRGLTKLIKITEGVRKCAMEHGVSESEALESGMDRRPRVQKIQSGNIRESLIGEAFEIRSSGPAEAT